MAATWVRTWPTISRPSKPRKRIGLCRTTSSRSASRHQLEVLRFGGAAEGVRLGHAPTLRSSRVCPACDTNRRHAERPLLLPRSPTRWAPTGLRWTGKLNIPLYRLSGGRIGGKVGTGAGPAADHHRPQIRAAAHRAGRLPRRRRRVSRDQHQRRQRQDPGLVAQPAGQSRGRGRGRPQAHARSAPGSPRARSAPTSGASTTSSTPASTTTRRSSTARSASSCSSRAERPG